jgi:bifunctional UDP-N-acetylglucosamine pyrophosphorylase/glucosamine-1-phosphate N-acetyltransferase
MYNNRMKLVILAAGEGVRMRPLTLTTPKPLLVYRGKPALEHLFDALPPVIDEVIITVNYLAETIRTHCGGVFCGRKITYVDGESGGNAVGFMKCKEIFKTGERFAVSYADDVLTQKEIFDSLEQEFSWLCYYMNEPKDVGIIEVDMQNRVKTFVEKPEHPTSHLVADGFMVVNSDIFSYTPILHKKGEYYFADLMAEFCKHHDVVAVVGDPRHSQLTTPEDIERLNTTQ